MELLLGYCQCNFKRHQSSSMYLNGKVVDFFQFKGRDRRVWRYQKGNQDPYIEEEQTAQWPKETAQKDKQRSTKHTYQNKNRVTRTPLKTGGELRCSGRVSSSCTISDTVVIVWVYQDTTVFTMTSRFRFTASDLIFDFLCLTPLSTIFQLCHGNQF